MERILRSVFQVGGVPQVDQCIVNWNRLVEYDLDFPNETDRKIYEYLQQFYNQLSNPPDFALIYDRFNEADDIETVSRLGEIKSVQSYHDTNFLSLIKSEREKQTIKAVLLACRDTQQIVEHGRNLEKPINGKTILRGPQDAINYFFERSSHLIEMDSGEKLEGVITEDVEEVLQDYDQVENSGKFTGRNLFGLEPVDSICQGHRSGEFWVHCAHPSELKTSLALNYAYNNSVVYGKSIFYAILEMPYKQLRRQLYVLHSSNGKFINDWWDEDKRNGIPEAERYTGIDYRAVREGTLTQLAKKRFVKVAQDFRSNCKGKLYVWKPAEEATISDIRRKAEMFANKYGCDGIVIDYLGKVRPTIRSSNTTDSINSVVSEARNVALNFGRGKGVPLLGLFQMNRQGKLRADKAGGVYDVASISYANRIMEDADVVSWTYLNDELRHQGKFYMGCLKNRDNPVFERMTGKILWQSKRMRALENGLIDWSTDQARLKRAVQTVTLTQDDMIAA